MKNKLLTKCILIGMVLVMGACRANAQNLNLGDGLFAQITTNRGEIIVRLEYQRTPLTVTNFVALAEGNMASHRGRRFYDGLTFHRVISVTNGDGQDFMIQGGCPDGNGRGGPGYRFPDEFDAGLQHNRPGILSMANAGPGTNGSQFFITIVPTPHLDGRHTVFGHVVQGQNIVNTTRQGDRIERITIIRNGEEANAFKADQENFDRLLSQVGAESQRRALAQSEADIAKINADFPNAQRTASGIRYIIQAPGRGAKPRQGQIVRAHYTGRLLDGTVFDSSVGGQPFEVRAGTGRVIQGWDETLLDMQAGEKRLVIIPPELAYGDREVGGIIPANSYLVFEMELISFE
ncbi:MAG: peptidylprolyl isomerase [Treponema sp.]|nr:peptidylprolyl isomerase [Treponema sp.]